MKYKPVIFILAYLILPFLPFFNTYDRIGFQFLYLNLINIVAISYLIYNKAFFSRKAKSLWTFDLDVMAVLSFLIFSGLSIFLANNKVEAIIYFSQILIVFTSYLIIKGILNRFRDVENIIKNLFIISLILESCFVFIILILEISYGYDIRRGNQFRGFMGNINITAFSILFKIPILLFYFLNLKNKKKIILVSLFILIPFCSVLITGSRAAFLTLILLITAISIINFKKHTKKVLVVFFALIVSNLFINSISDISLNSIGRLNTLTEGVEDQSINQRFRYYKYSLNRIFENPFVGIGIGNWRYESIYWDRNNLNSYVVPYHNHNDFLQIASEVGLFGLVFYLLIYFFPIRKAYYKLKDFNNYKNSMIFYCLLSMLVFFFDSMINFPLSRPNIMVSVIITLGYLSIDKVKV